MRMGILKSDEIGGLRDKRVRDKRVRLYTELNCMKDPENLDMNLPWYIQVEIKVMIQNFVGVLSLEARDKSCHADWHYI